MSLLQNKVAKVNKDVLDKYGIEEKVSKNVYMTPSEAGDLVYKQTLEDALKRGISADAAAYTASTARSNAIKDLENRAKTTKAAITESSKESRENTIELQKKVFENATKEREELEKNLRSLQENYKLRDEYGKSKTNEMIADYESKIAEAKNKEENEMLKYQAMIAPIR